MLLNAIIMNFASSSLLRNKLHHMSMPEQFSVIIMQKNILLHEESSKHIFIFWSRKYLKLLGYKTLYFYIIICRIEFGIYKAVFEIDIITSFFFVVCELWQQ